MSHLSLSLMNRLNQTEFSNFGLCIFKGSFCQMICMSRCLLCSSTYKLTFKMCKYHIKVAVSPLVEFKFRGRAN